MGGENSKQAKRVRDNVREREGPLNVLVIGRTGAGKSTFINSMQMALGHRWHQVAISGRTAGNDCQITRCLKRYELFLNMYMKDPVEGYRHTVRFWDCCGFTDHSDDKYVEFFRRVLEGYVPDGTQVTTLFQNDTTVADLQRRFPTRDVNRRIHRIVLAVEADRELPTNLMEAVQRVAQTEERDIPIFLLMTKLDKIDESNMEEYGRRKADAIDALNLVREDQRFCETYLYCNEKCKRDSRNGFHSNKQIDEKLTTFCCNLTDPAYDAGLVYANVQDRRNENDDRTLHDVV
ncbi:uncharacterized protein LOC144925244 [Branchiostoma floridae x Branchiostoma belcheri]